MGVSAYVTFEDFVAGATLSRPMSRAFEVDVRRQSAGRSWNNRTKEEWERLLRVFLATDRRKGVRG